MAAAKPGTSVAQKPGTALANYKERLAAMAKQSTEQEASVSTGQFLSVRAGQLTWQGNPAKDNKLKVIILDSILENAYYPGEFDSDNPQPPVCFAFGRDEKTMKPHEDSFEKQHETCAGCKWNEFKTAARGKGKACKNIRRLAMIAAEPLTAETVQKGEVAFLKTPVTSVKAWAGYVRTLDALEHVPPLAVITELGVIPDPKSQYKVTFQKVENIPENLIGPILDRSDIVAKEIDFPYSPPSSEPAPAQPNKNQKNAGAKKKF